MLLLKPYLGCNIACKYCYESLYRRKHPPKKEYNIKAILKRMEEFNRHDIDLHGGEILTLPKKDVETLLNKAYALRGVSGLQTNATLIDNEYIEMFKKYKTEVGVSWDGPEELSAYRPGTQKVGATIECLVAKGINVSLIIVVSKANAGTPQKLKKLKNYLLHLKKLGITSGRLNPCLGAREYEVPPPKLAKVYLELAKFCLQHGLRYTPFPDVIRGLKGEDRVCYFNGCDPFSTPTAIVVLNDGSLTNCMRTNKRGVLLRDPAQYQTRDEILAKTPQEDGGCQGCSYWWACHGGCPTGTIADDWRNRTYLCPVWKALFGYFEKIVSFGGGGTLTQPSSTVNEPCVNPKDTGVAHGDSPHGDHTNIV